MYDNFYQLMLVTHRQNQSLDDYLAFVKQCVEAGVTSIQLREKNSDSAFKYQFAIQLKNLLSPYQIPLIINDDIQLAYQVEAQGVHLGQSDGSILQARQMLGERALIGLSIESEDELFYANKLPLSYVAASAVFASSNKNNLKTIWGVDGVLRLSQQTRHPLIGIGGITVHNLTQVLQAGAVGAAVIGALHDASDPAAMVTELLNRFEG